MSDYITVVTNPELGWDCVVGVYDHNTSERNIKRRHGKDVILHTKYLSTIEEEAIEKETIDTSKFETVKLKKSDEAFHYMLYDQLKIDSDDKGFLSDNEELNENDQKIILGLLVEFLEVWKAKGNTFDWKPTLCVANYPFIYGKDGQNLFTSNLKFDTIEECEFFGQWSYESDFEDAFDSWLFEEKGIDVS